MRGITRGDVLWLVALTLGALCVRLVGIDAGLPQRRESDAYIVTQAEFFAADTPAAAVAGGEFTYRKYPHLLARLLACALPPERPSSVESDPRALLRDAAEPVVRARLLVAVLSAFLVPATWWLVRRLFGRGVANLAALFVATSFLHFTFSQQARPHGPHATFAALSVLASISYLRHGGLLRAGVAGLSVAAAVATLQFGFFTIPPLLVALAQRVPGRRGRILADAVVAAVPVALAVVAFYPWVFNGAGDAGGTGDLAAAPPNVIGDHDALHRSWSPSNLSQVVTLLSAYDPVLLALGAAGLLGMLLGGRGIAWRGRREQAGLLVWASHVVPYLVVVGGVLRSQERFLLPVLPFLAAGAGLAVNRSLSWLTRGATPRVAAAGWGLGAVVVLAFPSALVGKAAWLRSRPDTLTLAARWLETNADRREDVILAEPGLSLPLVSVYPRRGGSRIPAREWDVYLKDVDPDVRRALGYRILTLVPRGSAPRTNEDPWHEWTAEALRRTARETRARWFVVWGRPLDPSLAPALTSAFGEPVARFPAVEPSHPPLRPGYGYQGLEMIRRAARGVSFGGPVDVHRVGPAKGRDPPSK